MCIVAKSGTVPIFFLLQYAVVGNLLLLSIGITSLLLLTKDWHYFTPVIDQRNSLLLIRYQFFTVTYPLQLLVTAILKVTKCN